MSDSTPPSGQRRLGENQCNSNFRSLRVDERSTSGIQQALHPSSSQNQNPEEINQDQIEKAENREVEDEDERKANMIDLFQENPVSGWGNGVHESSSSSSQLTFKASRLSF